MPCRDKSGSLLANFRKIGRLQPFRLCRVPAPGCQPVINSLILLTKSYESQIFTPGQGRHNRGSASTGSRLHAGLDRVYGGYMARTPRQCPGTCARFPPPTGPRPAIFGDFLGRLEGLKAISKPFFSIILNKDYEILRYSQNDNSSRRQVLKWLFPGPFSSPFPRFHWKIEP